MLHKKGGFMEILSLLISFLLFFALIGLGIWVSILSNSVSALENKMKRLTKDGFIERKDRPINVKEILGTVKTEEKPVQSIEPENIEKVTPQLEFVAEKEVLLPKAVVKEMSSEKKKSDFAGIFLGNIFNKIGALAIIIALIIFIKLVSPYIIITDTVKIVLGYLLGVGLLCGGLKLHTSEKVKAYAEVLTGVGFAAWFITTFCANYLNVFNSSVALIVGGFILLTVLGFSHSMKTVSLLVIGLIGGYLTPFMSHSPNSVVFVYLTFLNVMALIYTLKNPNTKWVNPCNITLTMSVFLLGSVFGSGLSVWYPVTLWVIYVLYDLIRDRNSQADNATSILNYIFLAFVTLTLFKASTTQVGVMYGLTGLVYAVLAYCNKHFGNQLYKQYEHYVLLNVWFSILFTLNDTYSVIAWTLIALILSYAVKKDKLSAVKHYISFYAFSAMLGVLLAKSGSGDYLYRLDYSPIVNYRTFLTFIPILSFFLAIRRLKEKETQICDILRFFTLTLLYSWLMAEIVGVFRLLMNGQSAEMIESYTWSVVVVATFGFSLIFRSVAKKVNSMLLTVVGAIFGISAVTMLFLTQIFSGVSLIPFINLRLIAYGAGIYWAYNMAKAYKYDFFKYLAVFFGFLYFWKEGRSVDEFCNIGYVTTVCWLLYSGVVTLFGILKRKNYLTNAGIGILILSVLRVFIVDLSGVEAIYKIIAFLLLGMVLLFVSYIYLKNKSE